MSSSTTRQESTQPVNGYTRDRVYDDWVHYNHIFDDYTWLLDTYNGLIVSTRGVSPKPFDKTIELPVASRIQHGDSETSIQSPSQKTRVVESMADFGGAVELGELVPLENNTTVAIDNGLLSIDESSVTYTNVDVPDGTPLLNKHHAVESRLHPRDRPDISVTTALPNPPVTFIHADTANTVNTTSAHDTALPADGGVVDPATPADNAPSPSSMEAYTNPISTDELYTGDAVELLERVRPESVQLSVFSPPYNIGKQYGDYDDNTSISEWYSLMSRVFEQLFRATKPDGKVVVNIGKSFSETDETGRFFFYPLAAYIKQIAIESGFDFWDEVIWEKRGFQSRGGGALMGSYPDPTNFMVTQTHEHVLVFRKWVNESYFSTRTRPPEGSEKRVESQVSKDRWREITQSVWDIDGVRQSSVDVEHSAVYPEELPKRAIELYSFKGDTVLDPFVGTGTTAVAAKKAGRHYIGFDQNTEYVQHARTRVENTLFDKPGYTSTRDSNTD